MPHGFNLPVFLIGTLAALAGIGLATIIWLKPILKIEKLEPAFGWLAKIVENKYYIDEIYKATIIRGLMLAAAVMYLVRQVGDRLRASSTASATSRWLRRAPGAGSTRTIVDGLVNLVGWITRFAGRVLRHFQTGVAQQYVFLLVVALVIISVG